MKIGSILEPINVARSRCTQASALEAGQSASAKSVGTSGWYYPQQQSFSSLRCRMFSAIQLHACGHLNLWSSKCGNGGDPRLQKGRSTPIGKMRQCMTLCGKRKEKGARGCGHIHKVTAWPARLLMPLELAWHCYEPRPCLPLLLLSCLCLNEDTYPSVRCMFECRK